MIFQLAVAVHVIALASACVQVHAGSPTQTSVIAPNAIEFPLFGRGLFQGNLELQRCGTGIRGRFLGVVDPQYFAIIARPFEIPKAVFNFPRDRWRG
jgi:hypothetical protein